MKAGARPMAQSVTWHDRRWRGAIQADGFRDYEDFISARTGQPVWERSATQTFRLTARDPEDGRPTGLYLKKYRYPRQRWRSMFRPDKPSVEQRNYEYLRRNVGNVVPIVVATGRRRQWMMLRDAFILTVELSGCDQLDTYAQTHWEGTPVERERVRQDRLIETTADLIRRMHEAGFYHIDLQWRNILVRFEGEPEEARAFLIDAPRGGRLLLWVRRRHGRLRDLSSLDKLARLYLTRTQRLRWFTRYTGRRRISPSDRRLIEAILADRARYERARARRLNPDE